MNKSLPIPHTPVLQRPNVQHLGLILGGIGAGMVSVYYPDLAKQMPLVAGVTGAVASTAINLFSDFTRKCFDRREHNPTLPDVNDDFLRLVGNAIAGHIARFADSSSPEIGKSERTALRSFAGKASAGFVALVHSEHVSAMPPQVMLQLLADVATDESAATLGEINNWRKLVAQLAHHCQVNLNINTMIALASWLHAHLWHSLETELKKDFAGDGKAYAVLHLSFMGAVLAHLQTLTTQPQEQERLTRALSEKVQKLLAQDHISAFQDVYQPYFDGQFAELKVTLTRIEAKLDAHDDVVVDKLLARMSEKDQEIGRLSSEHDQTRAQLQAALQRLAKAEAKGNVSAGETLAQLRKDGNPKPLGAFLDQQLAEKQTDLIALLRERAAVAYVSGDIARAEHCLRQILATLPDDLSATNELGHIYHLRGDLLAAEKQYQRLLELAPDDEAVKAAALGNLGLIYQTQGKLAEAEQFHRDALAIEQKLGRLAGQATQLGNLGLIYRTQGKLAEAEQFHRDALAIEQKLGRLAGQVTQLGNLGLIYQTQGKLAEAEQFHRDALAIEQKLGRLAGQASDLGNLGLIYRTQGKLAEAEQFHRDALAINQKLGRLEGQASDLGNLGLIYRTQGKLAEAEQFHRDALAINQKLGRLEGQAAQLGNLGVIYRTQGKLAEAEQFHRDALAIEQKLGRLEGQATQLGNLGLIYQTQGKLAEAEQFHRDALAINQKLDRLEGQAAQLGNLGLIYQTQGKLAEAEQYLRDALAIDQKLGRLEGQTNDLGNLGSIAKERGNIAEARRLWTEARDLFTRVGMAPEVKHVEQLLADLPE